MSEEIKKAEYIQGLLRKSLGEDEPGQYSNLAKGLLSSMRQHLGESDIHVLPLTPELTKIQDDIEVWMSDLRLSVELEDPNHPAFAGLNSNLDVNSQQTFVFVKETENGSLAVVGAFNVLHVTAAFLKEFKHFEIIQPENGEDAKIQVTSLGEYMKNSDALILGWTHIARDERGGRKSGSHVLGAIQNALENLQDNFRDRFDLQIQTSLRGPMYGEFYDKLLGEVPLGTVLIGEGIPVFSLEQAWLGEKYTIEKVKKIRKEYLEYMCRNLDRVNFEKLMNLLFEKDTVVRIMNHVSSDGAMDIDRVLDIVKKASVFRNISLIDPLFLSLETYSTKAFEGPAENIGFVELRGIRGKGAFTRPFIATLSELKIDGKA